MEEFYPSEIARLVLGYLKEVKCPKSYETFLGESSDLEEHNRLCKKGKVYSTNVNGKSLSDILKEYVSLKRDAVNDNNQNRYSENTCQVYEVFKTPHKTNENAYTRFRINQKIQTQSVSRMLSPSKRCNLFRTPPSRSCQIPRRHLESQATPLNFGSESDTVNPNKKSNPRICESESTSNYGNTSLQNLASDRNSGISPHNTCYSDSVISVKSKIRDRQVRTENIVNHGNQTVGSTGIQTEHPLTSVDHQKSSEESVPQYPNVSRSQDENFNNSNSVTYLTPKAKVQNPYDHSDLMQIDNLFLASDKQNLQTQEICDSEKEHSSVLNKSFVYQSSEITAYGQTINMTTLERSFTPQNNIDPPAYNRAPHTNSPRIILSHDRSQIPSLSTPMKSFADYESSPKRKGSIPRRRLTTESPLKTIQQPETMPFDISDYMGEEDLANFFGVQMLADYINKEREKKEYDGENSYVQDVNFEENVAQLFLEKFACGGIDEADYNAQPSTSKFNEGKSADNEIKSSANTIENSNNPDKDTNIIHNQETPEIVQNTNESQNLVNVFHENIKVINEISDPSQLTATEVLCSANLDMNTGPNSHEKVQEIIKSTDINSKDNILVTNNELQKKCDNISTNPDNCSESISCKSTQKEPDKDIHTIQSKSDVPTESQSVADIVVSNSGHCVETSTYLTSEKNIEIGDTEVIKESDSKNELHSTNTDNSEMTQTAPSHNIENTLTQVDTSTTNIESSNIQSGNTIVTSQLSTQPIVEMPVTYYTPVTWNTPVGGMYLLISTVVPPSDVSNSVLLNPAPATVVPSVDNLEMVTTNANPENVGNFVTPSVTGNSIIQENITVSSKVKTSSKNMTGNSIIQENITVSSKVKTSSKNMTGNSIIQENITVSSKVKTSSKNNQKGTKRKKAEKGNSAQEKKNNKEDLNVNNKKRRRNKRHPKRKPLCLFSSSSIQTSKKETPKKFDNIPVLSIPDTSPLSVQSSKIVNEIAGQFNEGERSPVLKVLFNSAKLLNNGIRCSSPHVRCLNFEARSSTQNENNELSAEKNVATKDSSLESPMQNRRSLRIKQSKYKGKQDSYLQLEEDNDIESSSLDSQPIISKRKRCAPKRKVKSNNGISSVDMTTAVLNTMDTAILNSMKLANKKSNLELSESEKRNSENMHKNIFDTLSFNQELAYDEEVFHNTEGNVNLPVCLTTKNKSITDSEVDSHSTTDLGQNKNVKCSKTGNENIENAENSVHLVNCENIIETKTTSQVKCLNSSVTDNNLEKSKKSSVSLPVSDPYLTEFRCSNSETKQLDQNKAVETNAIASNRDKESGNDNSRKVVKSKMQKTHELLFGSDSSSDESTIEECNSFICHEPNTENKLDNTDCIDKINTVNLHSTIVEGSILKVKASSTLQSACSTAETEKNILIPSDVVQNKNVKCSKTRIENIKNAENSVHLVNSENIVETKTTNQAKCLNSNIADNSLGKIKNSSVSLPVSDPYLTESRCSDSEAKHLDRNKAVDINAVASNGDRESGNDRSQNVVKSKIQKTRAMACALLFGSDSSTDESTIEECNSFICHEPNTENKLDDTDCIDKTNTVNLHSAIVEGCILKVKASSTLQSATETEKNVMIPSVKTINPVPGEEKSADVSNLNCTVTSVLSKNQNSVALTGKNCVDLEQNVEVSLHDRKRKNVSCENVKKHELQSSLDFLNSENQVMPFDSFRAKKQIIPSSTTKNRNSNVKASVPGHSQKSQVGVHNLSFITYTPKNKFLGCNKPPKNSDYHNILKNHDVSNIVSLSDSVNSVRTAKEHSNCTFPSTKHSDFPNIGNVNSANKYLETNLHSGHVVSSKGKGKHVSNVLPTSISKQSPIIQKSACGSFKTKKQITSSSATKNRNSNVKASIPGRSSISRRSVHNRSFIPYTHRKKILECNKSPKNSDNHNILKNHGVSNIVSLSDSVCSVSTSKEHSNCTFPHTNNSYSPDIDNVNSANKCLETNLHSGPIVSSKGKGKHLSNVLSPSTSEQSPIIQKSSLTSEKSKILLTTDEGNKGNNIYSQISSALETLEKSVNFSQKITDNLEHSGNIVLHVEKDKGITSPNKSAELHDLLVSANATKDITNRADKLSSKDSLFSKENVNYTSNVIKGTMHSQNDSSLSPLFFKEPFSVNKAQTVHKKRIRPIPVDSSCSQDAAPFSSFLPNQKIKTSGTTSNLGSPAERELHTKTDVNPTKNDLSKNTQNHCVEIIISAPNSTLESSSNNSVSKLSDINTQSEVYHSNPLLAHSMLVSPIKESPIIIPVFESPISKCQVTKPVTPSSIPKFRSPYLLSGKPKSMEYFYRSAFPDKNSDLPPISPVSFSNSSCTTDAFSVKRQLLDEESYSPAKVQQISVSSIEDDGKTKDVVHEKNINSIENESMKLSDVDFEAREKSLTQVPYTESNHEHFEVIEKQKVSGNVTSSVSKEDLQEGNENILSNIVSRKRKISESCCSETCSTLVDCSDLEVVTPEKNDWLNKDLFSKEKSPVVKKRKLNALPCSSEVRPTTPERSNNFKNQDPNILLLPSKQSAYTSPVKNVEDLSSCLLNANAIHKMDVESTAGNFTAKKSTVSTVQLSPVKCASNTRRASHKSTLSKKLEKNLNFPAGVKIPYKWNTHNVMNYSHAIGKSVRSDKQQQNRNYRAKRRRSWLGSKISPLKSPCKQKLNVREHISSQVSGSEKTPKTSEISRNTDYSRLYISNADKGFKNHPKVSYKKDHNESEHVMSEQHIIYSNFEQSSANRFTKLHSKAHRAGRSLPYSKSLRNNSKEISSKEYAELKYNVNKKLIPAQHIVSTDSTKQNSIRTISGKESRKTTSANDSLLHEHLEGHPKEISNKKFRKVDSNMSEKVMPTQHFTANDSIQHTVDKTFSQSECFTMPCEDKNSPYIPLKKQSKEIPRKKSEKLIRVQSSIYNDGIQHSAVKPISQKENLNLSFRDKSSSYVIPLKRDSKEIPNKKNEKLDNDVNKKIMPTQHICNDTIQHTGGKTISQKENLNTSCTDKSSSYVIPLKHTKEIPHKKNEKLHDDVIKKIMPAQHIICNDTIQDTGVKTISQKESLNTSCTDKRSSYVIPLKRHSKEIPNKKNEKLDNDVIEKIMPSQHIICNDTIQDTGVKTISQKESLNTSYTDKSSSCVIPLKRHSKEIPNKKNEKLDNDVSEKLPAHHSICNDSIQHTGVKTISQKESLNTSYTDKSSSYVIPLKRHSKEIVNKKNEKLDNDISEKLPAHHSICNDSIQQTGVKTNSQKDSLNSYRMEKSSSHMMPFKRHSKEIQNNKKEKLDINVSEKLIPKQNIVCDNTLLHTGVKTISQKECVNKSSAEKGSSYVIPFRRISNEIQSKKYEKLDNDVSEKLMLAENICVDTIQHTGVKTFSQKESLNASVGHKTPSFVTPLGRFSKEIPSKKKEKLDYDVSETILPTQPITCKDSIQHSDVKAVSQKESPNTSSGVKNSSYVTPPRRLSKEISSKEKEKLDNVMEKLIPKEIIIPNDNIQQTSLKTISQKESPKTYCESKNSPPVKSFKKHRSKKPVKLDHNLDEKLIPTDELMSKCSIDQSSSCMLSLKSLSEEISKVNLKPDLNVSEKVISTPCSSYSPAETNMQTVSKKATSKTSNQTFNDQSLVADSQQKPDNVIEHCESTRDMVESDIGRSNEEGSELANAIASCQRELLNLEYDHKNESLYHEYQSNSEANPKSALCDNNEEKGNEECESTSKLMTQTSKLKFLMNKIKLYGLDNVLARLTDE